MGGPVPPSAFIPTPFMLDPERARQFEAEQQKVLIRQLQLDVEKLKKEREQRPQSDAAKDLTERLLKIASEGYEHGRAYTHIILFAGYGAFFAMWSMIGSQLSAIPATISILLMVISITVFVFFEVFKMATTAIMMRPLYALIQNPDGQLPLAVMQQRLKEFQAKSQRISISSNRVWEVVLLVCLVSGGLAVIIFVAALVQRLIFALSTALS